MSEAGRELEQLLALMRTLRDPVQGCPWDREQSFASIAPFTVEEAYEVADAIDRSDLARLRDELGDLLFQVVFHARMAEEQGAFDFAAVARGIHDKLVRRHPHVFDASGRAQRSAEVGEAEVPIAQLHVSWEQQKARERAAGGAHGVLADVPPGLPALVRATKLGRRARRVGFDWPDAQGVRAKVEEELAELDAAVASGSREHAAEELGDLLFAVANWGRHLNLDAEDALRRAGVKFERRFVQMENVATTRAQALESLTAEQWEQLWQMAKSLEQQA